MTLDFEALKLIASSSVSLRIFHWEDGRWAEKSARFDSVDDERLGPADHTAGRIMDYLIDEEIDKISVRQARHLILNAEPYASEEWIDEVVKLLFVWGLVSEHVELGPMPVFEAPELEWVSTHVDEPMKTITTTWMRRDGSTVVESKHCESLERIA